MHNSTHILAASLLMLFIITHAYPPPPTVRNFERDYGAAALGHHKVSTAGSSATASSQVSSAAGGLQLKLINQAADKMYAYIMGHDSRGKIVFLEGDQSTWYHPSVKQKIDGATVKFEVAGNSTQALTIPDALSSGRVYIGTRELTFAWIGKLVEPSPVDPASPHYDFPWGIVELDYGSSLCANPSFVDSVGLALGVTLVEADGTKHVDPGLPKGALKTICEKLEAVSSDWGRLCVKNSKGAFVRALSPEKAHRTGSLVTLYDDYIDKVWTRFESTKLTINTGYTAHGSPNVTCQVQARRHRNSTLVCTQPDGAVFHYQKPTTADVFGCDSGPFRAQGANQLQDYTWPRLCAAFLRATLLLDGGEVTPSSQIGRSQYYTGGAVNQYAKIVHETLTNRTGSGAYTFPFDDVNAPGTNENESGVFTVDSAGATVEVVIRGV